jgi:hypothetical protein
LEIELWDSDHRFGFRDRLSISYLAQDFPWHLLSLKDWIYSPPSQSVPTILVIRLTWCFLGSGTFKKSGSSRKYFFSYFRIFLFCYQIFESDFFFVINFSYFLIRFYYRAIK